MPLENLRVEIFPRLMIKNSSLCSTFHPTNPTRSSPGQDFKNCVLRGRTSSRTKASTQTSSQRFPLVISFRIVSYSISSSRLACTSAAMPTSAVFRASFDEAYVIRGYIIAYSADLLEIYIRETERIHQ